MEKAGENCSHFLKENSGSALLEYGGGKGGRTWIICTHPPLRSSKKCSPLVGGPAAVADALTHRGGASHRPWAVGAPARWAGFNFPTGINLGQCSPPPHIAETSALVTKTLV